MPLVVKWPASLFRELAREISDLLVVPIVVRTGLSV
jgi:hypothetical protein